MPKLTVAALRRGITTGSVLDVLEHRYPALLGRRTVVAANTTGFYLTLPENHPRYAETPEGSFVAWPTASGLDVDERGAIVLTSPGWDGPLMRLTVTDAAAPLPAAQHIDRR